MQEFIVGAKSYRQGKLYEPGDVIVIPDNELPSKTWRWSNGAPVQFEEKRDEEGNLISRKLKPMGDPPPVKKEPTAEELIAAKEGELRQLRESLKGKKTPTVAQAAAPSAPKAEDADQKKDQGKRPSDKPPA